MRNTDTLGLYNKIAALHKLTLDEMPSRPMKSREYISEAARLNKGLKNKVLDLQIRTDLENYYKTGGLLDSALTQGYENLVYAERIFNDSLKLYILSDIGIIYSKKGITDSAIHYHIKGLRLAEKTANPREIIRSHYFLGALYNSIGNSDKAYDYFLKCNKIAITYGDDFLIGYSYDGIASYYYSQEESEKAISYYQQSVNIYKKLNKIDNLARCYLNLGTIYDGLNNFKLSINYYKQALAAFENLKSRISILSCYLNMGATYTNFNKYDEALECYYKAEALGKELNSLDNLQAVYENLSLTYKLKGDAEKALEYFEKFSNLKDSVLNINKLNYINELEKKYELEKKEAELVLQKRRNYLLVITSCLLFIISLLVFFIFRQKARNARDLTEKNEQLYRKKINEIIKEQELKSINEIMEGQESERKRIAEDLHDRLGSMLATVKLHFNAVEHKIETLELKSMQQYQKANQLLDEVCDEVRKIAHNMESGVLVNFGLVHALTDLKEALENSSNLNITVNSFGMSNRLGTEIEISIYRVIQELLSNVIKHAKASEVTIDLNRTKDLLTVILSDNGKGYDSTENEAKTGMGLKNIRSRVSKLAGKFYVDSGLKNGTTNIIEIPLKNDQTINS